jgi:hypothetical protein
MNQNRMKYCSAIMGSLLCATAMLFSPLCLAQTGQEPVELGGTTIIGDRELPIGLFISPWRSANPDEGIDRPSRYLDVGTQALDPDVFRRQVEYMDALDAAARRN